jgi:hypothetical protein
MVFCPSHVTIAAVLFRLTTAPNQPINTVADRKDGETGSSDRCRRTAVTTLLITTLAILGLGQIRNNQYRNARQRKYGRNSSKFHHLGSRKFNNRTIYLIASI